MIDGKYNRICNPILYWPSEGNYDYQQFETNPVGELFVTVSEDVCIPFSEYTPETLNTYNIKYITQHLQNI